MVAPRDLSFAILSALLSVLVAGLFLTEIIPWGDDPAGYLLQAKALLEGRAAEEVLQNATLLAMSDWRVGPDGYPWGYPALLALLSPLTQWDMAAFRLTNLLFQAISGFFLFQVCREMGLSRGVAGMCVALSLCEYNYLVDLNEMGTDAPFLAFSCLLLWLTWRVMHVPGVPVRQILALSLVTLISTTFRSNGYVYLVVVAMALAVEGAGVLKMRITRNGLIRSGVFVAASLLGVLAYFEYLPDGSLIHVTYLSLEPESLLRRLGEHAATLGILFPLVVLPASTEMFAGWFVLFLSAWGALLDRRGVLLGACAAGHLILLTIFPVNAGARYYVPIVPVLLILSCIALIEIGRRISASQMRWLPAFRYLPIVVLISAACYVGLKAYNLPREEPFGPFSREMDEVIVWLAQCSSCEITAFDKPRMLRWRAGFQSIVIEAEASLAQADAVVLRRVNGSRHQLTDEQVLRSGQFRLERQNAGFKLYVKSR